MLGRSTVTGVWLRRNEIPPLESVFLVQFGRLSTAGVRAQGVIMSTSFRDGINIIIIPLDFHFYCKDLPGPNSICGARITF